MAKYFLIGFLLIVGGKFGISYILSEDFQKYADESKKEWTCHVNLFLGNVYITWSRYEIAYQMFERILTRCPETPVAESALFRMAECAEGIGHRSNAAALYEKYVSLYPKTKRAKLAGSAASILRQ